MTFAQARADGFAAYAATDYDYARTVDSDHGRVEIRRQRTLHDPELLAHLDAEGRWARLGGIGLVEAQRHVGAVVTPERRSYLLSAPLRAAVLERAVRRRWGIENRGHYPRDVSMGEDAGQQRADRAPQALAALRNGLLSLFRSQGWSTIAEALRHYGADAPRALHLLGALPPGL